MRTTPFRAAAWALLVGAGAAQAQQAPAGVQAEMQSSFDDAAGKIVQLAEAIPAEKYAWRPAEGVRSVAEVLMLDDELRELIVSRAPIRSVKEAARRRGFHGLREAAAVLVAQGQTTLQELNRVTLLG